MSKTLYKNYHVNRNAKVGWEDINYPTIGKHSLHESTNDNGSRLIAFAASKNMVIGGTTSEDEKVAKEYRNHVTALLQNDNSDKDDRVDKTNRVWEVCKNAVNIAVDNILGTSKPAKRKEWFDNECQEATETKNAEYKKMIQRSYINMEALSCINIYIN
ncbi:hypothetical protein J437_LFUL014811 [Ladona fulva]|uniref:Uncharacterized protein n=1 Tax=Ladona fulva TaxID=123851 RepID=A0A8K0PE17_LADFU|nr:hypothetical protein J437_LFUL014811 [Ladona fulva]